MGETSGKLDFDEEEEENENHSSPSSVKSDASSFLVELNLVMIIASLSLSNNQELLEYEDDVEEFTVKKDQQDYYKAFVSKLHTRKRGFDDLKIPDRRSGLQSKVLDSRHGRKM
ncbi:hypothetical protein SOVF_159310 [Spinacia oleracea]|uniref:Uncharacterized protein n=1 Tax=Spinacia oleracea TaxID=3562 RepID=A0A9R0IKG0_SPIOL|nr:uncharacterized protein LOC110790424 [Spinacia oleracea]KNA08821.1 hypothetical protein SOVF_159310 [Spinacia oleracea]